MRSVGLDTIVVGIDDSPYSDEALRWAIEEARRSNRQLKLVHVWHWTHDALNSPMSIVSVSDSHKGGRHLLRNAAARARHHEVPVTTRLLEGGASGALVDASEGAAMLVVGSHSHSPFGAAVLGSVSRSCVQHAHCPVVVIPPGVASPGQVDSSPNHAGKPMTRT